MRIFLNPDSLALRIFFGRAYLSGISPEPSQSTHQRLRAIVRASRSRAAERLMVEA
jgi:hypothetical protein